MEDEIDVIGFLRNQAALAKLNEEQLQFVASLVTKDHYKKGEILIKEYDPADNQLYFILEGEIAILKNDDKNEHQFTIGHLGKGEMFGEISFIDSAPRSSTVKAVKDISVLKLSKHHFNSSDPQINQIYNQILTNLLTINTNRLRNTNQSYVKSLRAELDQMQLRNEFGRFFIIIIISFGVSNALTELVNFYLIDTTSPLFSWCYLSTLLLPILYFIRKFSYSLKMFGVTTKHWRISVTEALGICLLLYASYWLLHWGLEIELHIPIFTALKIDPSKTRGFTPYVTVYALHAYIQEFIARGVIQSSLQRFFDDKRGTYSILVTSSLFGIFHLHIGIKFAVITAIASVFFGWIYNRNKNLMGVAIVHYFLGVSALRLGLM